MKSNTQRTLEFIRKHNGIADMVERWLQYAQRKEYDTEGNELAIKRYGVRADLFGFIDIIAMFPGREKLTGIQSCGQAFSEHYKKIVSNPLAPVWLQFADLELWGWRKVKKVRGKAQKIWEPRIHVFTLEDMTVMLETEWQEKYKEFFNEVQN